MQSAEEKLWLEIPYDHHVTCILSVEEYYFEAGEIRLKGMILIGQFVSALH